MATVTLRPSGDGTTIGWTRSPASGTFASKIVDDPDSHDGDTTYVLSPNVADGQMFVDLDNVPADFDPNAINSITLKAAAKKINTPNMAVDLSDMFLQLFRVDEITAISNESTVCNVTDTANYQLFSRTPTGTGSHSVDDWNGVRLRLRYDHTAQQNVDTVNQIRITAAEVIIDYNPAQPIPPGKHLQARPAPVKVVAALTLASNLLLTTLAPAAATPRAPIYANIRPVPIIRVEQPPNLLPTLLGEPPPPVEKPFAQYDWPNPPRLRALPLQERPPNLLLTTLAQPFRQLDWVGPQVKRAVQPELAQNLLALDPSKGVTFSQLDWPIPIGKRGPPQFDSQNLLTTTLEPAAPAPEPFKQTDWPTPKVKPFTQPELAPNLLTTTLAPVPVQDPFRQTEWLVPSRRAALQPDITPNLLTTTLAPAPEVLPFAQYNWPVPQRPLVPLGELRVLRIFPDPFRQREWPLPPARKLLPPQFDPPNLLATTLAPAPVQDPFIPANLPQLRRVVGTPQPELPPNLLTTTLAPPPVVQNPFFQTNWPNPQRIVTRIDGIWIQSLLNTTLAPNQALQYRDTRRR